MDVLFDLDGTLIDPKPGIVGSFQYALETLGLPVPPVDDLLDVIGPPLRQSFPRHGVRLDDVERAVAFYRENYSGTSGRDPAMFDCDVYPGVEAVLDALHRAGCRLLVATAKPGVFAKPILRAKGLDGYFAAVHGAELDGTRDDKADLVAYIVDREGVDPAGAVMIGDRRTDITAAAKNDMRSIGATWGYGSLAELRDAGATALATEPKGLHRLVLWMLSGHG